MSLDRGWVRCLEIPIHNKSERNLDSQCQFEAQGEICGV